MEPTEAAWQQHRKEEQEAAEAYEKKRKQKVIFIDQVRGRLLQVAAEAEQQEIPLLGNFTQASFAQPVSLEDVGFIPQEGKYAAAGGGEFKRSTLSQEGIPIDVEFTRLGEQSAIHVRVHDEKTKDGIVRVILIENDIEILSCLVPFADGVGKHVLTDADVNTLESAPDTVHVRTRLIGLDQSLSQSLCQHLEEVKEEKDALMLVEPMIDDPSVLVRSLAIGLAAIFCAETALDTVRQALDDSEKSVREIAQQVADALSNG
ncbi:MAG: hypothetical protein ABIH23_34105 [bacterium]